MIERGLARRTGEATARGFGMLWRTRLLGFVVLLAPLIMLWEYLAGSVLSLPSFPRASEIIAQWWELLWDGELLMALVPTFQRLAIGFFGSAVIAIPLGVWMGSSRLAYNLFEPIVELLRPIPASALVPLFIIFLGLGDNMNIALIAFASFFPILLNTFAGVRGVDPILVQTARTFGMQHWKSVWRVRMPAAMPMVFTGLRISLAVSLILAVVAEMLAGNSGIGFFTIQAQRGFRVTTMYSGILTLGIVGYVLNRLFLIIESRLIRWHFGFSKIVV